MLYPTEEPHLPRLEPLLASATSYTGIGSRKTPSSILYLIERLATTLAHRRLLLRSGGAPGADTAFETGCDQAQGRKEIFLPWKGFHGNPSPFHSPPAQALALAARIHPNWPACNSSARLCHARNIQQICGVTLSQPVDFVLFWAPQWGGQVRGGTATAVHFAQERGIPTFNLWYEAQLRHWMGLLSQAPPPQKPLWRGLLGWLR